jgi:hypothetical protein
MQYSLLDHRRNEDILEDLKAEPGGNKLAQYKQKGLNHVSNMNTLDMYNNSLTNDLLKEDLEND